MFRPQVSCDRCAPVYYLVGLSRTECSFAYMEINLLLAKKLWKYDLELINQGLDWLNEGKVCNVVETRAVGSFSTALLVGARTLEVQKIV